MGELVRSIWRSVSEVGLDCKMVDVYGPFGPKDPDVQAMLDGVTSRIIGDGINIFCINGDEVETILEHMKGRNAFGPKGYNIIYPAWELETYPPVWARQLERFDEVWGFSQFIAENLKKAVTRPVFHLPLATEVRHRKLYSRKHFGIRESAYAFFFAFDFLSFIERKNPFAVIDAFAELVKSQPFADACLVIKTNNADRKPEMSERFYKAIAPIRRHVTIIDGTLEGAEMKSLMSLCDCYVSLHRSEGYGFGLAEAMYLGKPVIATAYSGNMDFCTPETTYLIPHTMKPLSEGDYPHWEGQAWAEPDSKVAYDVMLELLKNPELGRSKGKMAQRHIMTKFSYLACGLHYADRVDAILQSANVPAVEAAVSGEAH